MPRAGSYPDMFLSFLLRCKGPTKAQTNCCLWIRGCIYHTHKHISPAETQFMWIQSHTRLFWNVQTWCFGFQFPLLVLGMQYRYSKEFRILAQAFPGSFTSPGAAVFQFISVNPCLAFSKSFFRLWKQVEETVLSIPTFILLFLGCACSSRNVKWTANSYLMLSLCSLDSAVKSGWIITTGFLGACPEYNTCHKAW